MAAALMPLHDVGLSKGARLVLIGMCNLAKDTDDPPTYYGGWARLSEGLGYRTYDGLAERATARHVAELRKHGLIVPVGDPGNGRRVPYEIRL